MSQQASATGSISIEEIDLEGKYVQLKNNSEKVSVGGTPRKRGAQSKCFVAQGVESLRAGAASQCAASCNNSQGHLEVECDNALA